MWEHAEIRGNARKRAETRGNARKHARKHVERCGNTRKRAETCGNGGGGGAPPTARPAWPTGTGQRAQPLRLARSGWLT
eukprot:gene20350-biopygen2567